MTCNMKGKIRRIACLVGLLLILAGLCVGGYPIVSNWYCEYQAGKEISVCVVCMLPCMFYSDSRLHLSVVIHTDLQPDAKQ